MPDASAGSGIPAIRTFQFDSSAVGQIASSVNLFRGDVNIPQTLFSLPSRHSGSGLDIDFSIFYQSNVFQSAALRNLEAPTSVLGLGWDLPLTFIEATGNGSPDPDTRTYTLHDNGSSNVLIRQALQPFLFSIPTALANALQAGEPVPSGVRSQFLELGLPLDAGAAVSRGNGNWTLRDDTQEQCFVIQTSSANANVCNVCYGGQAFQLRNYSFWHIVYFPMYERWLLVTDDGIRKSFGGGVGKTANGYATSAANSIARQVWWTLNGIPAWTGPSSLTAGQQQVARAWYLVSASDPFGDAVTYAYNGWTRNANGLIPDVEQQVGKGGLPYTKAVYLTQVTDVFGRTVKATYGEKLWSSATDDSAREYADPHRATPSNDPNGYQDCYETKYLHKLVVSASNGTPVFTARFGYCPRPQVQGPEQAVANVNSYSGPLQGDTFKRYLTSIVMENGAGASLPGFRYDYHLDPAVASAQPGALRTLTFPQGGQVYFETTFPTGSPTIAIAAGNVTVTWSGSAYACTAAGQSIQPLAMPPHAAQHWLLVAGDGVMLFFADGQLLFSQVGNFAYGPPVISVGAGLGVTHLAMLASPRVGLSYHDGSSRQRQVHQLYGADCRISEKIFDPLDRLMATTRVAPGSFGAGVAFAPLQYRNSFVDVGGFLNNFKSTGVMSGNVALYYAGQHENGVSRSNDQDYPYYGTLWESSPRRRRIEHGLPGKPYAIANLASTTPAQRATTQYAYGSNSAGNSSLPPGQYTRTAVTTPLKSSAVSLQDQRSQSVATWQLDAAGATTVQSAGLRTYAQSPSGVQATMTLNLPNALLPGPQSGNAAFVRTTVSDGAGRAITAFGPNAGQTQFLYDPCGRIRFVQPALDPGEQWFLYNKYDALGRLLERGTIPQAWNVQSLAVQAANMNWPDASVSRTVTYLWSYDGDGNTAAQIGQKTSCVTTTAGPQSACVTTEVFTYDPSGRLSDVSMSISGPASASGATSYVYNNLGELIVLTQPAGSPLEQVFYTINDQGWITAIGSAANALTSIASYTYTIDGNVETESLGGSWTRSAQYLSPGWVDQVVTKSSDGSQSLSIGYTYNADSSIASRKINYSFAALSGALADNYTYDGQGRLQAATGSSNDQVTSYDPNGNIWAVTQAGNAQRFPCVVGKDQVSQTQVGGQSGTITYDARGRVTTALGRALSYDNTSNLTVAGKAGGDVVQLGYGGHGQRVLKVTTGASASQSEYFTGASPLPVVKRDGNAWSALVYGPTGLVAIVSDQTYYPLKDRQQSVWAVVNTSGLVARYVYLPFGAMVADGPSPNISAYRFMGQEWDAELSLCNFRDRMYDPVLRRFLVPDVARQFPSPYVFCGNNPLNATDPSGDSALGARIGIGLGLALTILATVALSIFTLGAAAPAAAAADAATVGAGVGAEAAAGVTAGAEGGAAAAATGAEAAAGTSAAAAGQAAAEGGAAVPPKSMSEWLLAEPMEVPLPRLRRRRRVAGSRQATWAFKG